MAFWNSIFVRGLVIAFFICASNNLIAQDKYYTKTGNIVFEASVPSFEEVYAENNAVTALLNRKNGEIAVLALVKGFRFKIALMEEHFNESYAESSTFPTATFQGKIVGFSIGEIQDNKNTYTVKGSITFHGKTVEISAPCDINTNEEQVNIQMELTLDPEEFNIKIPKIIQKKVAEQVHVRIDLSLKPR
jgi:hypothetical protein